MQVDSIKSYNMKSSSPNFGALKIKPDALPDLQNAPSDVIKMIDLVGEELKSIKNPVMEIRKGLRPRLIFDDGVVLSGSPTPIKPTIWTYRNYIFWLKQEPNTITGLPKKGQRMKFQYKLPTYQHAIDAYAQMKKMAPIEKAAAIVKLSENIYDFTPKSQPKVLIDKAEQLFTKYGK